MESTRRVPLAEIAHARSGDKGNHANIAVFAYTDAGFGWLREHLTADAVRAYFAPLGVTAVHRYEVPNLRAVNFVLENVLDGGASRSLRSDSQGKALATALLRMECAVGDDLENMRPLTPSRTGGPGRRG